VKHVSFEPSAQDVMNALTRFDPKDTAIVFARDSTICDYDATSNTTGAITLVKNDNDEITYLSQAPHRRFAVFGAPWYDGFQFTENPERVPQIPPIKGANCLTPLG